MNKYSKLGENILLMTLGSIGSKLITFLLVPLYTSALTTEQYGTIDLLFTLYNLLIPVFTFECYFALMRFSLEDDADHTQLFSASLYINAIGILLLACCYPVFKAFNVISDYYWLFIFYCFATSLNNILLYFARGLNHVRDYALSTIINTLVVVVLNIYYLIVLHLGIEGYLLAYTIAPLVSGVYLSVRMHVWRFVIPPTYLDFSLVRKMAVYCIPLIPNSICWWISNQSDKFVIILFDGIALSGVYAISQKIPSTLNIVSNIFVNAWQISSVEDFGSDESKSFYSNVYDTYLTVQMVMTSLVLLFCRLGAVILFKKDFFTAWHYVPILAIGAMFHALGSFFASVYTAGKRTGGIGVSTIIAALVNIAFNFLLIPRWHAYGAAVATLISYMLIVFIRLFHSRTFFTFEIPFGRNFACYLVLFAQAFITYIDSSWRIVASALCLILLLVIRRDAFIQVISFCKRTVSGGSRRGAVDAGD